MKRNDIEDRNNNSDSSTTPFKLTVFLSDTTPLNKTITLVDGKLNKAADCLFADGDVEVVDCPGLSGFMEMLEEGEGNVAFAMGRPFRDGKWLDHASIVTKGKKDGIDDPDVISRTKKFFKFKENEPCVFLVDIDGIDGSRAEILEKLQLVDPQLKDAGHLIADSSSSHIKDASTGEVLTGSSGLHLYYLAKNGRDIERYGKLLAKRAWLAGLGHIKIDKAGRCLTRQLMDESVYSPERLIFEAPATLGDGIIQERPPIEFHDGGLLDTEQLQDLHPTEFSKYYLKITSAREEVEGEADQIREHWLDEKTTEIASTTGCDKATARIEAKKSLDTDQLPDTFTLLFDDHGLISVEELFANPEKYDEQTMADPIEHDYNGGRSVAKFYWNNGNPRIYSFARGKKTYKFVRFESDEAVLEQAIKASADDPGAHWEDRVIKAARSIYNRDRAEFQRLRVRLKQNCKDARITEWDKEILRSDDENDGPKNTARELVNLVNLVSVLFHDDKERGYATIDMDTRKETWGLESDGFKRWLEYTAYKELKKAVSETTVKAVITVLQGQAKYDGDEINVYIRCAPVEDGYVIDLANDRWQVVHVTKDGWDVLDESPVKFIRSNTCTSLPAPSRTGGSIDQLWSHVNIPETDRTLVLAFMLDSFRPDTDFSILELCGEQGTAKSSTHTRIRQLTDPNSTPLRSAPKSREDLIVSTGKNWQASFENMSYLSAKMQDALCTVATGGGFAARKLYSDDEEAVIDVKRPIIINAISPVATSPDLISRVIHIDLPSLKEFISKKDLDERFEKELPDMFSGLLDVLSDTLRALEDVDISRTERMVDFISLGKALHKALNDKRSFVELYRRNKSNSLHASLEASPVALALWDLAKQVHPEPWDGTTKKLKEELAPKCYGSDGWVKSPKGLGVIIDRMGPALRVVGVHIKTERTRDGYMRHITYSPPPDDNVEDEVHDVHKCTDSPDLPDLLDSLVFDSKSS